MTSRSDCSDNIDGLFKALADSQRCKWDHNCTRESCEGCSGNEDGDGCSLCRWNGEGTKIPGGHPPEMFAYLIRGRLFPCSVCDGEMG